jgi:hypothetical protein
MKLKYKLLVFTSTLVLTATIIIIIFLNRSPVLIVVDQSFLLLCGAPRVRTETRTSSLVLFRWVRTIAIADDAGDDIVQYAIAEVSAKPHCVIFPLRFAQAARIYREENQEIPVVILEGRHAQGTNPSAFAIGNNTDDFFIYKTDITADFHRAALAAIILDNDRNERIVILLESSIQRQGREVFLSVINELENPLQTSFFTSFSQLTSNEGLSSVVLAGIGAEYLDRYSNVPVIFFTWISPDFIPLDVILVFDDSPWAQVVPAVRMVDADMTNGQIPSKILVLPGNGIDKAVLRKLRKI